MTTLVQGPSDTRTLIDALLEEQRDLTAVEQFVRWHETAPHARIASHRQLIPLSKPKAGEQYGFEVDLERCSGCKSCVTACHALNGLDDEETWRSTGLLHSQGRNSFQQTVTTACHHCVEPGCLEGCPVLAYDKDPLTGIVRHLDDQCIGCQYCIFMCPYEVPKYSARHGIVRKCDMCQQRLAHEEAPACVQACPSEAIRITVVEAEALREQYRPAVSSKRVAGENGQSGFLPSSPDPAITLPTTRYVASKPLPQSLIAGDWNEIQPQPAHLPLMLMLIMTQLGSGGFALLPFSDDAARTILAPFACVTITFGLALSILHLGRPKKAWRAFLGLRHSWLSREIVVFGCFAAFAIPAALGLVTSRSWAPMVLWPASFLGLLGVFCSGMTYHVTRRECWRGVFSIGRFFGTTLVLGAASAWTATACTGTTPLGFSLLLAIGMLVKLSFELGQLRLCADDAGLNDELPDAMPARGAYLMRFRFAPWLRARFACAWAGGVILPLVSLLLSSAPLFSALPALLLCLTGETLERLLFFRAVAVRKMPGMPHQ